MCVCVCVCVHPGLFFHLSGDLLRFFLTQDKNKRIRGSLYVNERSTEKNVIKQTFLKGESKLG